MKRYRVLIIPAVHDKIEQAFEYIYEQSEQNGIQWLQGIYDAINTLETMPTRCGTIREEHQLGREIRELLFFSHRIIFEVMEGPRTVRVLEFRHAAQDQWQVH